MVSASDLSISSGFDPASITQQTTRLVDDGRWRLCHDGKGLERNFKFKTFKTTWNFMNEVAEECKKQKHHPEWTNAYNRVRIIWTTHSPEGLSERDTTMAGFCDEAAERLGEIVEDGGAAGVSKVGGGGGDADADAEWKRQVKDCCAPKG